MVREREKIYQSFTVTHFAMMLVLLDINRIFREPITLICVLFYVAFFGYAPVLYIHQAKRLNENISNLFDNVFHK